MIDFSMHPLVETAWLAEHLSDDDMCIVDARWRGDGSLIYAHAMTVCDTRKVTA